jgi:hypothetical protein
MAFSGKLVEPTKLDKITLRQAAISFNKGKKHVKIKTKIKEIVTVTEVTKKKDCNINFHKIIIDHMISLFLILRLYDLYIKLMSQNR